MSFFAVEVVLLWVYFRTFVTLLRANIAADVKILCFLPLLRRSTSGEGIVVFGVCACVRVSVCRAATARASHLSRQPHCLAIIHTYVHTIKVKNATHFCHFTITA